MKTENPLRDAERILREFATFDWLLNMMVRIKPTLAVVFVKPYLQQALASLEAPPSLQPLRSFPSVLLGHTSQSWGPLVPSWLR